MKTLTDRIYVKNSYDYLPFLLRRYPQVFASMMPLLEIILNKSETVE